MLDPSSLIKGSKWCNVTIFFLTMQAANLAGFRASEDPRFEAGIPDFMNGILNFSIHFNVVHRKVDWRNPKMKSLNSMPAMICIYLSGEESMIGQNQAVLALGFGNIL